MQLINFVFDKHDKPSRNFGFNKIFTEADCKRMIFDAIIEGRHAKAKEIANDLKKIGWSSDQITNFLDVTPETVEEMLK